jgi:hypothetical protein
VCSPRIRQARAQEIDAAAKVWVDRYGAGSVMLLTLTMPHDHAERLADLLRTIRSSFGAMISGKAWQTDKGRFGLDFYIVAHDTTVGANGWHPHLHVMLFADRVITDEEVETLGDRMHKRWARAVKKRGHREPSRAHGIQLERARSRTDVARYVCQVIAGNEDDDQKTVPVALEVARGDLKTSRFNGQRTHWQVLSDFTERRAKDGEWTEEDEKADNRDVALWQEWEKATKGVRAIRWAQGLRAAVGLADEKTDEEVVAEEVGGEEVFTFTDADSWKAVASTPGARALVLRAAESGGQAEVSWAVHELLRAWRARRLRHGLGSQPTSPLSVRKKPRRRRGFLTPTA